MPSRSISDRGRPISFPSRRALHSGQRALRDPLTFESGEEGEDRGHQLGEGGGHDRTPICVTSNRAIYFSHPAKTTLYPLVLYKSSSVLQFDGRPFSHVRQRVRQASCHRGFDTSDVAL